MGLFDMVKNMVKTWLEENGYDGLCLPDEECRCAIEDFMPCRKPSLRCEAWRCEACVNFPNGTL